MAEAIPARANELNSPAIEPIATAWLKRHHLCTAATIQLLGEGSNHWVWRVSTTTYDFAFRWRKDRLPGYLGSHERERAIWQSAAAAHLAPTLHEVDEAGQLWVSDYAGISGLTPDPENLAQLMRQVHQLPAVNWRIDYRAQTNAYLAATSADRLGSETIAREVKTDRFSQAITRLARGPQALCHNDLTMANVLLNAGCCCLVDWEYAAMGSIYFDAAATLAHLDRESHEVFVRELFGTQLDARLLNDGRYLYAVIDSAWRASVLNGTTEVGL